MFAALLYLQYWSLVNRTAARLRRLKKPKYWVGAIVGGIYFYFYFFRYLFGFGQRRQGLPLSGADDSLVLYGGLAALVLFLLVLLGWLLPRERAALAFSEAEVAFLFPAPVSRKGLIHYKLLRSQFAILFTTFFLMLLSNRFGGKAWIHAGGWWCVLSTLNLHLLAASFARTKLLDRGITHWQRRTVIVLLVAAGAGAVVFWLNRSFPSFEPTPAQGPEDLKRYARAALQSGPLPWLLLPFRLVVQPYFATNGLQFLYALGPACLILLVHYLWVVRANVAFEEASVEASRKLAEKIASVRAGNWQGQAKPKKAKRSPFVLRPVGPAPVALLWKNLISAGQAFSFRFWLLLAIVVTSMTIGIGQATLKAGATSALGIIAATFVLWSLMIGPQLLRQDFRQDLPLTDVLKSLPLKGWQVALGELLAPAAILTGAQWLLILLSMGLLLQHALPDLGRSSIVSLALSAALLLPMLNLITLQIPNAAVLLFPAWFQPAKDGAHGIEATGQRIIFMLAQLFAFILALLPAAVVFIAVFFVLKAFIVIPFCLPLASVAAALVLSGEAALGILLLGRAFEKLDVAEITP